MKKYEYKCVFIGGLGKRTTMRLNEYGRDGWELVCNTFMAADGLAAIQTFVCTFKREKK